MSFPNTIYPALATLVAACLVFLYSFVNMLVSKDQKTTEFRQAWIDSLREEVAILVAKLGYLTTQVERLQTDPSQSHGKRNYLEQYGSDISEMASSFHKIQLRIKFDAKDENELALSNKLFEIEDYAQYENMNTEETAKKANELISIAQKLLKKEWERVKRGERSFYISKLAFIGLIILSVLIIAFLLSGYVQLPSIQITK